ncbi:hypothetical protein FB451DRAFT_1295434 [Mycena latifolia]|nr:hypothetical protein FB451DRAFT_1295434 [Mycena latifolia]
MSALSRPVTIPKLLLVARRVKQWLEPLLFRVICLANRPAVLLDGTPRFEGKILLQAIKNKPNGFLNTAVRHLCIAHHRHEPETGTILAACRNTTNLCITYSLEPYTGYLEDLPLRHLTLSLDFPVSFSHSMFRHITHLEVLDSLAVHDWKEITLIPHLTHFAFSDINVCHRVGPSLLECRLLECVVLHLDRLGPTVDERVLREAEFPDDVRFVTMSEVAFYADWQRGAYTGEDFWLIAEGLVASKRANKALTGSTTQAVV